MKLERTWPGDMYEFYKLGLGLGGRHGRTCQNLRTYPVTQPGTLRSDENQVLARGIFLFFLRPFITSAGMVSRGKPKMYQSEAEVSRLGSLTF